MAKYGTTFVKAGDMGAVVPAPAVAGEQQKKTMANSV